MTFVFFVFVQCGPSQRNIIYAVKLHAFLLVEEDAHLNSEKEIIIIRASLCYLLF